MNRHFGKGRGGHSREGVKNSQRGGDSREPTRWLEHDDSRGGSEVKILISQSTRDSRRINPPSQRPILTLVLLHPSS